MQRFSRALALLAVLVFVLAMTAAMASTDSSSSSDAGSSSSSTTTGDTTMFGCLTTNACEYCYTSNLYKCAQCREGAQPDGNGDCEMTPLYSQSSGAMTTGLFAVCPLVAAAIAAVVA